MPRCIILLNGYTGRKKASNIHNWYTVLNTWANPSSGDMFLHEEKVCFTKNSRILPENKTAFCGEVLKYLLWIKLNVAICQSMNSSPLPYSLCLSGKSCSPSCSEAPVVSLMSEGRGLASASPVYRRLQYQQGLLHRPQ